MPPFRGRAVHIRRRDLPFGEVEIDFETLERQKAAEYERLEFVLRFARDHRCRQQQILHYFGQTDSDACGHCDNCRPQSSGSRWGAPRAVAGPVLDAVRIVLSGVARVSQRRVGCGKQLLAKMLCGSNDKAVQRNRLDKLSTFGLLAQLKQTEVLQLTDALLLCGLLEQNEIEPFRPILQLTARGGNVMSGRDAASLNLPLPDELWRKLDPGSASLKASPADAAERGESSPPDPALVARLREWRETTRKAQNLPAYMILTNALVDELARERPTSVEALSAIKGIGPKKAEQFGGELVELLAGARLAAPRRRTLPSCLRWQCQRSCQPHGPTERPAEFNAGAPPAAEHPTHYWTWRLLSAGFTPQECAAIRSLAREVVLDHALRAADGGQPIDAAWFLSREQIAEIRRVIGPAAPERIRPLLERLPRGTRYEDVQLVVKSTWPDSPASSRGV